MEKDTLSELICPECGSAVVIYKGWDNFRETKIEILKGANWCCPNCGETGKLNVDFLVD